MRGNREVTISKINKDIALWYHTAEFGKVCTHFVFSLATGCLLRIVFFFSKMFRKWPVNKSDCTLRSSIGYVALLHAGDGLQIIGSNTIFYEHSEPRCRCEDFIHFHLLFLDLFHLPLLKVKFQL